MRALILAVAILPLAAAAAISQGPVPAPGVSILSPRDGEYVSGEVVITAAVQPPGLTVARVVFFADGRQVCTVERPPFTCAVSRPSPSRSAPDSTCSTCTSTNASKRRST